MLVPLRHPARAAILALLLSLFAIAPLAYPGFFQSYTGYSAVYNLLDLHARLSSLWSWAPAWGRVYDFLRMDGPLAFWLAELVHLVGVPALESVKLVSALGLAASGYGMFRLARRILGHDAAALLAAGVYLYFPAHLAAIYIRGAPGEALAWALFPFVLEALIVLQGQSPRARRDSVVPILLFAALMLAQPGLAILFGIFARVWLLVLGPHVRTERGFLRSPAVNIVLLGLGLGALLQVPAIVQNGELTSAAGFVPAFVYPFQLLSAAWGNAVPMSTFSPGEANADAAPYQVGIAALGLSLLTAALVLRSGPDAALPSPAPSTAVSDDPAPSLRRLVLFTLVTAGLLAVLMMPAAEPLWRLSGLDLLVQYPFQLLALIGFLVALPAGALLAAEPRLNRFPLVAGLAVLPILAVYPYLAPDFLNLKPAGPALARFNSDELALLDATIVKPPGAWRHGATVQLDLHWQALRQPNRDYTVFVHVLDDAGHTWGSTEDKPQGGTVSTLNWTAGRVYTDTHTVQIDLNGPPEGYHLELGLYQSSTGEPALTERGVDSIRIEPERAP